MALPKLDNTQLEKNQIVIIQKMDALHTVLADKLVPAVEKMTSTPIIEKMFPFIVQIADNIYNIAGKMEAQVTSLREVQDALATQAKATVANEGQQIEAAREAGKKAGPEKKEEKKKSALDRLLEYFDKVLLPLVIGFVIGLSKAFGGFETTFGKILTIFTALYIGLSGFRKTINNVVVQLVKALPELIGKIKGTIVALVNGLKSVGSGLASGISKAFNSIVSGVTKIAPNVTKAVVNTFREIVVMSANTVQKITSAVETIGKFFSSAGSKIAGFFKGGNIGKAIDLITDSFKTVFNLISKIGNVGKVAEGASKAGQFFAKAGQMFSKIGRLLGPIGVVISTVMALFQGIKGAFKGFDEEGVFGAIKGFTSGIITGFVGWIGDFATWVVGKLLSLLGFEELGDRIASLDFSAMLSEFINNMFDTVKQAFVGFFDTITGAFSKIFSGEDIIGGILDLLSAVPMMLIDLVTAPFKSLGDALKDVFDFDFSALAKKILIAVAPPDSMLGKVLGTGEMQKEVAASDAAMAKQRSEKQETATRSQEAAKMEEKRPELERQAAAGNPRAKEILAKMDKDKAAVIPPPVTATAPSAAPAAQPAIAMRPIQTRTPGQAISTDSQRVAAAQGGGGGVGGGQTNIVAPQQSIISAPQSQVVNTPLSAYGIFGGRVSLSRYAFSGF